MTAPGDPWLAAVHAHTDVLLDGAAYPGEQRDAALALFEQLCGHVVLDDRDPSAHDHAESLLSAGKALSPQDAARCLRDFARTGKFLRGVVAAITAARQRFAGERVRVLYAGSGPFALLVLPIAHRWQADEVRYTLLDVHARSLDAARSLASRMGVSDRIDDFVVADACTFRCEAARSPHVLVSETMQAALAKEPQVSIVRNLAPQLAPGGVMVPERVELHLTLMNPGREMGIVGEESKRERTELGRVLVLDSTGDRCASAVWPGALPEHLGPYLRTRICTFGDIVLDDFECSLTIPMVLSLDPVPEPGQTLVFEYRLTPAPHLAYVLREEGEAPRAG